jgi:Mg2+/Co2+ transporter CorB
MEHHIDFQLPLSVAVPLVLLCLALSAYMSAAETAITGASRPRMHRLAQQGNRRATLVNKLLERKSEAVNAVLLGNSVMNILSASLTTACSPRCSARRASSMPRSSASWWWCSPR